MKRDVELLRSILLQIEEHDRVDANCDDEVLADHLRQLIEQGFIEGVVVQTSLTGPLQVQQVNRKVRLTSSGHDFLDAVRDEDVWRKTKVKASEVGGGIALSVVAAIATQYLKEKLGLS